MSSVNLEPPSVPASFIGKLYFLGFLVILVGISVYFALITTAPDGSISKSDALATASLSGISPFGLIYTVICILVPGFLTFRWLRKPPRFTPILVEGRELIPTVHAKRSIVAATQATPKVTTRD